MNENSPNQKPVSLAITILLVTLSFSLCLAWFWQMVFVIPELERMFADFRIKVPARAQAIFDLSRFFVQFCTILLLFAVLIYAAIVYLSYHLRHRSARQGLRRLWFALIIGLPLGIQIMTLLLVLTTPGLWTDSLMQRR
jgi:type II secretory pathway component PulF